MKARPKKKGEAYPIPAAPVTERRTQLRYRFASLLTEGKFDLAVKEATRALENDEILERDFRFVTEIAKAAKEHDSSIREIPQSMNEYKGRR